MTDEGERERQMSMLRQERVKREMRELMMKVDM